MSHLPGKFVWFEHLSADIPKARRFYDALFGWHTESIPMGPQRYSMILNGDGTTSEGIGGYRNVETSVRPTWMSYLSVSDVDATYAAALAAGASAVSAPADFGPFGRGATLTDPTGAAISIWKSAEGDRPDPRRRPLGAGAGTSCGPPTTPARWRSTSRSSATHTTPWTSATTAPTTW